MTLRGYPDRIKVYDPEFCEITDVRDVVIGEDIYTRINNEAFQTVEYWKEVNYGTKEERKLDSEGGESSP